MSFLEAQLDRRVAYGFRVIPAYDTRIAPLDNGQEKRNVNRTRARRRYTAVYMNFTEELFEPLLAMYHAAKGAAYGFRFKDWSDYRVVLGSIGNTPGANTTAVQLVKKYTAGSQTTTRTITKPVAGTVTVYQDNGYGTFVEKPGTIDTTTGLFTPTTNWTAGRALKASFEFDVPVRFASDEMPAAIENFRTITTSCELIEVFSD